MQFSKLLIVLRVQPPIKYCLKYLIFLMNSLVGNITNYLKALVVI